VHQPSYRLLAYHAPGRAGRRPGGHLGRHALAPQGLKRTSGKTFLLLKLAVYLPHRLLAYHS
jgi:hypothetical protein